MQKLGEELIALKESELRAIGMEQDLLDAVIEAQRIKPHGALRRQKQYIGKIMRHIDVEPIRAALARSAIRRSG